MHVYPRDRLHCDYLLDRTASRSNQNHGSARVRLGCDGCYNLFSCTSCLRHVSKLSSKRLLDMFQLDNGDFVLLFCFILWQGVCNDTYMWTQVSGFTFILMHATGVCTPTSVVQQLMILHCAMLFMRLLFDLNKNCGIMLEWSVVKCYRLGSKPTCFEERSVEKAKACSKPTSQYTSDDEPSGSNL